MSASSKSFARKKSSYLVAMVVGTALSTFGPSLAAAAETGIPDQSIADVSRYCTACWRNARLPSDQWGDCTQEVLCRLLERVEAKDWSNVLGQEGDERRELVRAVDTVKKRAQRQKKWTPHPLETCSDRQEAHRRRISEERAIVEQRAKRDLSPRQQQIVRLSMDGWSVQQISCELKVPAERISDEKYKAIRKLRASLA